MSRDPDSMPPDKTDPSFCERLFAVRLWLDGELKGTFLDAPIVAGNCQERWAHLLVGTVNCGGNADYPLVQDLWLDGVAVSERRIYPEALVYLADSPEFATANKVSQALEHVADDAIRITVNPGPLGSDGRYLFVVNNRNERSSPHALESAVAITPPQGLQVKRGP